MKKTFLVEIGTEELPPQNLRLLARSFTAEFRIQLEQVGLQYDKIFWYASPRRLALKVTDMATHQSDRVLEKRGLAIHQAFDAKTGKPTIAAKSWARSCGITIEEAKRLINNDGEWLFHTIFIKGRTAKELLANMVANALRELKLNIHSKIKLMRWGNGSNEMQFIRPVHTLIMLLDDQLIEGEIFGIKSSLVIRGHRFMGNAKITINSAKQYPTILREHGKVIADYEERKALIKNNANKIAQQLGGTVELSDNLLEEVTSLVEWPILLTAKFEPKFLSVPTEVLVSLMKDNQKYFPIYDHLGNLMTNFIFVANIESSDQPIIIAGNERVISSRLADAEYFFKKDCKKRLEEYLPQLETVLFHKQLGTLLDKTKRLEELARFIAAQIGVNINKAARAGILSKCDLMTHMVFEFANMQGIIGMHYARRDGEDEDVAVAIKEHYQPKFSGDELPTNEVAIVLSLSDKLDTLVGIFGVEQQLKDYKTDPFALRRAAMGIIRIIVEKNFDLDLLILIQKTVELYNNKLTNLNVIDDVINFIFARFRVWYKELGYSLDIIKAVWAIRPRPTKPLDFAARIKAITNFRTLEIAKKLFSVNKRVNNLLRSSNENLNSNRNLFYKELKEPEEILLASKLVILQNTLDILINNREYQKALFEISAICNAIDVFLDNVKVMDSNQRLRVNRLTLLDKLRTILLKVADITLLH